MSGIIVTCIYCGHQYPDDTPQSGAAILTDHIRVCEKHPMRKAESDIALLRSALIGIIGASEKPELEQIELALRVMPAPEQDKIANINAIHALLATMPDKESTNAKH